MLTVENRTFDELKIGDRAQVTRRFGMRDVQMFAGLIGDPDAPPLPETHTHMVALGEVLGQSTWANAMVAMVLATQLPGPGTLVLNQNAHCRRPIALGEVITVSVTVVEKAAGTNHVTLTCQAICESGEIAVDGFVEVRAPVEKIRRPAVARPGERRRPQLERLLEMADDTEPMVTAVVHPVDGASLTGAIRAAEARLIYPVLVGPERRIRAVAEEEGLDIGDCTVISTEHSHAAAAAAVALARDGKVEALMKGSLLTDELIAAVLDPKKGLRTERRMSHVYVMDVPTHPRPLLITDAAVNLNPTLEEKRHIVQNAIELAHALGIETPRVAILSSVETVSVHVPSTLEAAALCKMAERGQIVGAVLDGPLGFDNAISPAAALAKGVESLVAGQADILVVPNLEAGNMLAKELHYLADAQSAGIVMGGRVPIMLTSRADDSLTRMSSCALALLAVQFARNPPPRRGHA